MASNKNLSQYREEKKVVTGPSKSSSSGSSSGRSSGSGGLEFTNPYAGQTGPITTASGHTYSGNRGNVHNAEAPATINLTNSKDNPYINYNENGAIRNAAVDSAAEAKKVYTPEDIKTYGNRETAYNFVINGQPTKVYSNYTRYDDPDFLSELGLKKEDEGKTWSMENATTYGISGSHGKGTTYSSSAGRYVHNQPASGGWYEEAGRAIGKALQDYGGSDLNSHEPVTNSVYQGLANVYNNQFGDTWKEAMVNNYLPVYGQDPNNVDWNAVASGAAAQAYHDTIEGWNDTQGGANNAAQANSDALASNNNLWNPISYGGSGGSSGTGNAGSGNSGGGLSYLGDLEALSYPTAARMQAASPLNYQSIISPKQQTYTPLAYQNSNFNLPAAALAYGSASNNADANIAMAQYWAQQAANARDEQTRRNALTLALKYRQTL